MSPARWQDRAACRGVNPDIFFPGLGEHAETAKAFCASCPVREECLDYALSYGGRNGPAKLGVWGGLTEKERRRHRRALRQSA